MGGRGVGLGGRDGVGLWRGWCRIVGGRDGVGLWVGGGSVGLWVVGRGWECGWGGVG